MAKLLLNVKGFIKNPNALYYACKEKGEGYLKVYTGPSNDSLEVTCSMDYKGMTIEHILGWMSIIKRDNLTVLVNTQRGFKPLSVHTLRWVFDKYHCKGEKQIITIECPMKMGPYGPFFNKRALCAVISNIKRLTGTTVCYGGVQHYKYTGDYATECSYREAEFSVDNSVEYIKENEDIIINILIAKKLENKLARAINRRLIATMPGTAGWSGVNYNNVMINGKVVKEPSSKPKTYDEESFLYRVIMKPLGFSNDEEMFACWKIYKEQLLKGILNIRDLIEGRVDREDFSILMEHEFVLQGYLTYEQLLEIEEELEENRLFTNCEDIYFFDNDSDAIEEVVDED